MARRIDVELTSARQDGSWTWRVAGARQPKGVVDAGLVPEGAKVGDVLRVEAEFELDGISVTAVLPSRAKPDSDTARLEILGPPREERPSASAARPAPRRDQRGRPPDDAGPRPPRRRPPERERPRREAETGRPAREREDPRRPTRGPGRQPRPERRERRAERPDRGPAGGGRRLAAGDAHRSAVLAGLPPEQRPIAEQVLRGGIPAVRQAVEAQNADLRAKGQPEVHAGPLVALAEELLPRLKQAEWRDRAQAAAAMLDDVSLRDLRSVVAGADAAARDDESRLLASTLREALERRVSEQRERWVADIASALDEGRLVRALRLSARPPDPGTRFPAELALRMSEAASAAMAPEVAPDRWKTLLEAVADSPVRRSVKPAGLPAEAGPDLLQAARQASGRVPALAPLLGIDMPPPPGPRRPPRPASRPPRPAAGPERAVPKGPDTPPVVEEASGAELG